MVGFGSSFLVLKAERKLMAKKLTRAICFLAAAELKDNKPLKEVS